MLFDSLVALTSSAIIQPQKSVFLWGIKSVFGENRLPGSYLLCQLVQIKNVRSVLLIEIAALEAGLVIAHIKYLILFSQLKYFCYNFLMLVSGSHFIQISRVIKLTQACEQSGQVVKLVIKRSWVQISPPLFSNLFVSKGKP